MVSKVLALCFGIFLIGFVAAQGLMLPHQFYGDAIYNGEPADNILVEVYIEGDLVGSTMARNGVYGGGESDLLLVKDSNHDNEGKTVVFFLNGVDTGSTFTYVNGGITRLDLFATGSVEDPEGGNGGGSSSGGSGGSGGGGSESGGSSGESSDDSNETSDESGISEGENVLSDAGIVFEAQIDETGPNFFSLITGAVIGTSAGRIMVALLFVGLVVGVYFLFRKKGESEVKAEKK